MTTPSRLDNQQMAQRVFQELRPGSAVALGPGLPGLVAGQAPPGSQILFLSESGGLGAGNASKPSRTGSSPQSPTAVHGTGT